MFLFPQNEARKLNHQEVAEEDRRKKLPTNWEATQRRVEWENKEEEARKVHVLHLHLSSYNQTTLYMYITKHKKVQGL